jgi:hypothetical protein
LELAPWVEAACLNDLASFGFTRQAEECVMATRSRNEPNLAGALASHGE